MYRFPVTVETLSQGFRGKQYQDISDQQPPQEAFEDTAQANVRVGGASTTSRVMTFGISEKIGWYESMSSLNSLFWFLQG